MWMIFNYAETGEDDRVYWSNLDGWTDVASADMFTDNEMNTLSLPIDGKWIPVYGR